MANAYISDLMKELLINTKNLHLKLDVKLQTEKLSSKVCG